MEDNWLLIVFSIILFIIFICSLKPNKNSEEVERVSSEILKYSKLLERYSKGWYTKDLYRDGTMVYRGEIINGVTVLNIFFPKGGVIEQKPDIIMECATIFEDIDRVKSDMVNAGAYILRSSMNNYILKYQDEGYCLLTGNGNNRECQYVTYKNYNWRY